MAVDERARHELHHSAEATMGRDNADTLMDLLPPVGWADVATKQDLDHLEQRMDAKFEVVDAKFDALTQRMDTKFDAFGAKFDAKFEGLTHQITAGDDRVLAAMRKELNGMVLKMFMLVVGLVTGVAAIVVPLVTLT